MNTDALTRLQEFYVEREIGHRLIRRLEDVPPQTSPRIQYLIAGNGVFLETANEILHVREQMTECRIKGLLDLEELFELRIPKVPEDILMQIIQTATAYAYQSVPLESMFYIYYSEKDRVFCIMEPEQDRQTAHVTYHSMPDVLGGLVKVVDVHSHTFACPYLSATDRVSSAGLGLYGVVGNLHERPQFVLYLGVYGEFFPLAPALVFEFSGTTIET
jgi:PRTRC genetic system protein A